MDEEKVYADAPDIVGSKLPLSVQEKAVAELHETIGVLAKRLKPVLTPVPEPADRNANEDKAAPSQSPLGEQISANTYGIHKAMGKLRALMERLEC